MKTTKTRTILYRRKREQKTKYSKRLKLLFSRTPRLVVRCTNQKIIAQIAAFAPQGDIIIVALDSFALRALGWTYSCKNTSAAYLTGYLLGKRALTKNCTNAILDTGQAAPLHKGKIYAFLKGAVDAGLKLPVDGAEVFPDEKRIQGEHVARFADHLKKDKVAYERQFTQYLKTKSEPEKVAAIFAVVKQKIK